MILQVMLGVAGLGAVLFFTWDKHTECVARIEGALLGQRAKNIRVKADWFDMDRDTMTYDVYFTDREGNTQYRRCKVTTNGVDGDALFWSPSL